MKIKSSKKYTLRFKKMAFGGEPDSEVLSTHTIYDENGNIIEEIKVDTDEGVNERNIYTYDSLGKLATHQLLMETEGISETFAYERDGNGRLISEIKYYGDDPGEKTIYSYAAHTNPIRIERYDADGEPETIEEIVYNDSDLPLEHTKMSPSGEIIEKSVFTYNDNKKPVEKKNFDGKGKLTSETRLSYNDKNLLSRITEINGDGKLTSDVLTTYDERDNIIERKVRDFHSRTLRFSFDDHDNCIAEEMYDENGNLTMRSSYEFDEHNHLIAESGYYMDMNRSAQMANIQCRYEYEYWETASAG